MHFSSITTTAALALGASAQLHQLAKSAGKLYFGSAVHGPELDDSTLSNYLKNSDEFGQITPGNEQKWDATEPNRNQFSFSGGDRVAQFAKTNGQMMRCHTLVWHSQLPGWVSNGQWSRESLTAVIETHIANVAGHFKGQCYAWDVVNEALEENGSYRDSVFSRVLGDSYYAIAFAAAAKADPGAKLYYNDYNLETLSPKQQGAARIVRLVKQAGVRIDGVGMQAHLIVGQSPSKDTLVAVMQSYLDAGATEVAFTELDIRHSSLPPSQTALARQGDDFAAVAAACLAVDACVGITTWGFTDKHSWVPGTFPGTGDALIFDSNYQKKPAYHSISSVFAAAATSGPVQPAPGTTLRTTTTQAPPAATTAPAACAVAMYGQCGGNGYSGCKTCASGSSCKITNEWYSQCL